MEEFGRRMTAEIDSRLAAVGQKAPFRYMNGAGPDQEVFQTYGRGNLDRLRRIRARYDPGLVSTRLLSGGFKLPGV
jgi:hypothetical protein